MIPFWRNQQEVTHLKNGYLKYVLAGAAFAAILLAVAMLWLNIYNYPMAPGPRSIAHAFSGFGKPKLNLFRTRVGGNAHYNVYEVGTESDYTQNLQHTGGLQTWIAEKYPVSSTTLRVTHDLKVFSIKAMNACNVGLGFEPEDINRSSDKHLLIGVASKKFSGSGLFGNLERFAEPPQIRLNVIYTITGNGDRSGQDCIFQIDKNAGLQSLSVSGIEPSSPV